MAGLSMTDEVGATNPGHVRQRERPNPESRLEQALEGKMAQESNDAAASPWPGY